MRDEIIRLINKWRREGYDGLAGSLNCDNPGEWISNTLLGCANELQDTFGIQDSELEPYSLDDAIQGETGGDE